MKANTAQIKALRPSERAYEVAVGDNGLRLRVLPSGVKVFRWYVNALRRVVTLGPWSESSAAAHVTIGEAGRWLERLKAARRAGLPELENVEAELKAHLAPRPVIADASKGTTIASVAENFLRLLDGQRKRPEEARYIVTKDILPVIGGLRLGSLKKSDCRAVVARVIDRGAKVHAGKVLGLLKQLLDYAENVEDDFVNPAARFKAANLGVENNVRDRWLTDAEIPLFWKTLEPDPDGALPRRSVPDPRTRIALRLLLLTAVRSAELRLARWEDLDLKAATWTIPVANQKLTLKQARQAKPFVIPLTPTAIALFGELRDLANGSPWVLASDDARTGHYSDKALARAMRRFWRSDPDLKTLPEASPHDLRRSARTWLGKLGVPPHIAERCLNHRLGRIVATYDQGDYLAERRAALEKWDACIERLVSPSASSVAFLPTAARV
ncbi:MAG: tyrosine-type recombinase/integrase [Myxococcaceae bacterium]